MGFPEVYRKTREGIIASYDFIDIADGTGVIVFLGSDTDDNGTVTYQLARNAVYSQNTVTSAFGTGSTNDVKVVDADFDVTFNLSKRIKGKVIANIPIIYGSEGEDRDGTCYVKVLVRHWDGSSETDIASNTKSEVSAAVVTNDTAQVVFNVEVDVTTETHFARGETLRITVEVYSNSPGAQAMPAGLMHDPKNREAFATGDGWGNGSDSADFITSILSFNVPFILTDLN